MDETASLTLGKRILYHRKRLGLTQDQLAERIGGDGAGRQQVGA